MKNRLIEEVKKKMIDKHISSYKDLVNIAGIPKKERLSEVFLRTKKD